MSDKLGHFGASDYGLLQVSLGDHESKYITITGNETQESIIRSLTLAFPDEIRDGSCIDGFKVALKYKYEMKPSSGVQEDDEDDTSKYLYIPLERIHRENCLLYILGSVKDGSDVDPVFEIVLKTSNLSDVPLNFASKFLNHFSRSMYNMIPTVFVLCWCYRLSIYDFFLSCYITIDGYMYSSYIGALTAVYRSIVWNNYSIPALCQSAQEDGMVEFCDESYRLGKDKFLRPFSVPFSSIFARSMGYTGIVIGICIFIFRKKVKRTMRSATRIDVLNGDITTIGGHSVTRGATTSTRGGVTTIKGTIRFSNGLIRTIDGDTRHEEDKIITTGGKTTILEISV